MPFLSEECMNIQEQIDLIKNLRLPPDFIINIKVVRAYFVFGHCAAISLCWVIYHKYNFQDKSWYSVKTRMMTNRLKIF